MEPPFNFTLLVLYEQPTQSNAAKLMITSTTLRVSGPYANCCENAYDKGVTTAQALRRKLATTDFDEVAEEMPSDYSYVEFFTTEPHEPRRHVSFIAVMGPPVDPRKTIEEEEEDKEMPLEVRLLHATLKTHQKTVLKAKSPSAAAQSLSYFKIQGSDATLLDGRLALPNGPATAAPPIELFHPAFASYKRDSENPTLDVPPDVIRDIAALLRTLSAVNIDDDTRSKNCRQLLAKLLNTCLEKSFYDNETSPYYFWSPILTPIDVISGIPVIIEIKSELGNGGSDPSLQVSFSYEQHCCAPERDALLEQSNCPSFLLSVAGPWIVICGAVLRHKTTVQRLSGYEWHACSRIGDEAQTLSIARKFFALRGAIAELNAYYTGLQPTMTPDSRFYPSFTSYTDENGNDVEFDYVKPLEMDLACIVFLAKRRDNGVQFVVKFVSRYNAAAHAHMATGGYAPRLLCHQPLGPGYSGWALVAMEYVAGKTIFDEYDTDPLPDDVLGAIQKALDYLHSQNYILPDLRRPNVMFLDQEDLPMDERIKIIDFDWACVNGDGSRYPCHLSSEIRKLAGAKEYDEITRAHEDKMFENL